MKQGRIVVVYDLATLKPLFTLPELFDKVFRLEYSPDGRDLWVHAKPHTRKGGKLEREPELRGGERRRHRRDAEDLLPQPGALRTRLPHQPGRQPLAIGSAACGKFQEVQSPTAPLAAWWTASW
ncbi:MAG: hypothetical protein R2810_09255 [Flavobacteriales bacterium]